MTVNYIDQEYQKMLEDGSLQDLPRDYVFRFECPPACMGLCCKHIEIFLDPWDVEVLARHLGITGREFIAAYGTYSLGAEWRWPNVLLRHAAEGKCAFLLDDGKCRVYPARPRNCRAYPLGRAVRFREGDPPRVEEKLFLLHRMEGCQGHRSPRQWTVQEWLVASDLQRYHELSDLHLQLIHYAVHELESRKWMHLGTAQVMLPFLYAPEVLRARLNIPETAVGHEEFYRRRMQALKVLLTEVAAGLGYGPGAVGAGQSQAAPEESLIDRLRPVLVDGE
jgi:Fe-S-cluster containining protein